MYRKLQVHSFNTGICRKFAKIEGNPQIPENATLYLDSEECKMKHLQQNLGFSKSCFCH